MNLNNLTDLLIYEEEVRKLKPISVGVAIIRKEKEWEILMVHPTPIYNYTENYGFPKGHMEAGEDEIETAKREGKEETGLNFEVMPKYRFEQKNPNKNIVIYLARLINNENIGGKEAIRHDGECDKVTFRSLSNLPPVSKNQENIMKEILKLNLEEILKLNLEEITG